jgi:hypothetical protein
LKSGNLDYGDCGEKCKRLEEEKSLKMVEKGFKKFETSTKKL